MPQLSGVDAIQQIVRRLPSARVLVLKEIAEILHLSPSTVETHRARIMEKLDVHSAVEIVLYAVRKGIFS
jgi:DNA-binding NarL/FixJ family response regulator